MKIISQDQNVWLEGQEMEEYFPALVKNFNCKKPSGSENETILNPNGAELVEGYVSLYSTAGDVAKIIQRASKAIKKMKMFSDNEEGVIAVDFMLDKNAFRGAVYSFNTKYEPDKPFDTGKKLSKEHIEKMQQGRKNAKKK